MTEHLKALHNFLTHPIGANSIIPVDKDIAHKLAQPPDGTDKTLWLYELCRFLTQKVNSIIVALFSDDPPCSAATCPEMRASEWQYLCAVHDPPKSCCAIDYCCHTLDWAANTLTSPKTFPSRLALDSNQNAQHQQSRHLTNIFRRVYRIFAHAWFQHRDMFWKVEGRSGLYIFFKTVCDVYGLIPEDNYTIPSEAEGIEAPQAAPPMILRREPSGSGSQDVENTSIVEGVTEHTLSTAGTTKRHRHSPSVGAISVATVVEENEEDEEGAAGEEHEVEVPHVEPANETSEAAGDGPVPSEEPTIGESAEAVDEAAPADALEASQAPDQAEKQSASEAEKDDAPATEEEKEGEAPEDQTTEPETKEVEDDGKVDTEVTPEVEATPSAEPEKTEKDEAADPEKSSDVEEPGEKPGSDE